MPFNSCCPTVPASESGVAPSTVPGKETSGCKNSCCDRNDAKPLDNMDPALAQEKLIQEESDEFHSPGKYTDSRTNNDNDAPDCCRGKVRPCCDTSCLDRLAMRECAMSAPHNQTGQPNSE